MNKIILEIYLGSLLAGMFIMMITWGLIFYRDYFSLGGTCIASNGKIGRSFGVRLIKGLFITGLFLIAFGFWGYFIATGVI